MASFTQQFVSFGQNKEKHHPRRNHFSHAKEEKEAMTRKKGIMDWIMSVLGEGRGRGNNVNGSLIFCFFLFALSLSECSTPLSPLYLYSSI